MDKSPPAVWIKVQELLAARLGSHEAIWLSSSQCTELNASTITLNAPSKLHAERIGKYARFISEAVHELTGGAVTVTVTNDPQTAKEAGGAGSLPGGQQVKAEYAYHVDDGLGGSKSLVFSPAPSAYGAADSPQGSVHTPMSASASAAVSMPPDNVALRSRAPRRTLGLPLKHDYTFKRYVVGENNRFAANAAIAISKNPGTAYNPLLIYGGVGLGKTHLMQAIGNALIEKDENKVIYTTAESFTNEFIELLRSGKMSALKNKYRRADALLIDDIHFLENKWETQEELFHTFNALYDANKQIVFTCDRPVIELKKITDRLKNRFERGLNVDLQPPSYETKRAILISKLESQRLSIPDEVLDLICNNISTNVRDLEAALTKIIGYGELVGMPVTLEKAQHLLLDMFEGSRAGGVTIDTIIRVVSERFGLTPNDLKAKRKPQNVVYPRQLAMHIARKITEYTTTEIGEFFGGKDHATVMYSDRKIIERVKNNPLENNIIDSLVRQIKDRQVSNAS
jgi:chromosomal replication initiator protein